MTLEWNNATRQYGKKRAVDSLTLDVSKGELLVLIGPSGCGKTTSLRMINRLVDPSSGSVLVDGEDVRNVAATELRRHIGYVIQQVGLFPHMTVADNVASVPKLLKWSKTRIAERVDELLDLVGLPAKDYAEAWPSRLSGGEAQRVGVARALAADPPILLMDEPFGAVDPLTREVLQREFLNIQSTLGKTVVFVTHDLDEAIRLGDRIAVMNEGRLIASAPPGELLLNADPFIRDFTGDDRSLRRLARLSVGEAMGDATPIAASGPDSDPPTGSIRTDATLKDALAQMLEAGETSLNAVTPAGRSLGRLTLEDLLENAAGIEASLMKRRIAGSILRIIGLVFFGLFFIPRFLDPLLRVLFPSAGEWVFPRESLLRLTAEHLVISLSAGVLAAVIGVTLGILVTRPKGRGFLPLVRDASSLAQTIPPAAVLALAIPFLGFGFKPVLLALVLYSVLPVVNNTLVGLETPSEPVLQAARGMGMNHRQVLLKVELPLALPTISTGIRTSVVINVGTATIGSIAGAGGLGSPIVAGLVRDNPAWVFQGAMASALLALLLNGLLKSFEQRLQPEGIRQDR